MKFCRGPKANGLIIGCRYDNKPKIHVTTML